MKRFPKQEAQARVSPNRHMHMVQVRIHPIEEIANEH